MAAINSFTLIQSWKPLRSRLSKKNYCKVSLTEPERVISVVNQLYSRCISVKSIGAGRVSVLTNHGRAEVSLGTGEFQEKEVDRHPKALLQKMDKEMTMYPKVIYALRLSQDLTLDVTENWLLFCMPDIQEALSMKPMQFIRGNVGMASRVVKKGQGEVVYVLTSKNEIIKIKYCIKERESIQLEKSVVAENACAFNVRGEQVFWVTEKGEFCSTLHSKSESKITLNTTSFVNILSIHKSYYALAIETGKSTTYHLGRTSNPSFLWPFEVPSETQCQCLSQQLSFFSRSSDMYLLSLKSSSAIDLFIIKNRSLTNLLTNYACMFKNLTAFDVIAANRNADVVMCSDKHVYKSVVVGV